MNYSKEDFLKWVSDPARTNDELFTVEMILEQARGYQWPHQFMENGWDAKYKRAKERRENPAHRPSLHLEELRTLIERVEQRTYFSGGHNDRPLRDLTAFRFFPFLTNLSVQPSDVTDFTPLAGLSRVTRLSIAEYDDLFGFHPVCLAQCGAMPELETLHLALRHPWPDLRGIAHWPKLNDLNLSGAILPMEEVEALPAARVVVLNSWCGNQAQLRDLKRLAAMPVVRVLTIDGTASLEGIERYPSAVNLEIAGCFRDLSPLAQMHQVTALKLTGERFMDLRPLSAMKNLRELVLLREWPIDLAPLTNCPQLRRVSFERSAMMQTEVVALNAALLPEAEDFFTPTPRPLPKLKCYRLDKDSPGEKYFRARGMKEMETRKACLDGDAALEKAALRVFVAAMQTKFDQLLGRRWGIFEMPFTNLKRYKDTTRLPELVDAVRDYQRRMLHPLNITFIVEPHGDMTEEMEAIKAREAKEAMPDEDFLAEYSDEESARQENEEFREHRKERYERLKREHMVKLLGDEQAGAILSLPEEEPELEELDEEDEEEGFEIEPPSADDDGRGVAIAPPPLPPPTEEPEGSLSESLMFYLEVWEDCVTCIERWASRAEYCLGQKFEPWRAAPESIAAPISPPEK